MRSSALAYGKKWLTEAWIKLGTYTSFTALKLTTMKRLFKDPTWSICNWLIRGIPEGEIPQSSNMVPSSMAGWVDSPAVLRSSCTAMTQWARKRTAERTARPMHRGQCVRVKTEAYRSDGPIPKQKLGSAKISSTSVMQAVQGKPCSCGEEERVAGKIVVYCFVSGNG